MEIIIHTSPSEGGTVKLLDNGVEVEPCDDVFDVKDDSFDVEVEAIPAPGYCFVGWDGEEYTINRPESPLPNPFEIRARTIELTAVFAPEAFEYGSRDGTLQVRIPYGTYALNDGVPVTKIGFTILDDPPQSDGAEVIGHAYRLEPAGATFSPAVIMTWSIDPADIPGAVAPEDLTMAYYDESHDRWVALDSEIDAVADTISAPIDHLSVYAILAPTEAPPSEVAFSLSQLNIRTGEFTPGESVKSVTVSPGRKVYIDVFVQNTSDTAGKYTVTLEIDGAVKAHRQVSLGPGGFTTETFDFDTSQSQPGTYTATINGLGDEASFTVIGTSPAPQAAPASPADPGTATPAVAGASPKVLAPVLVAIFFAIFIPIRIRLRRNRDWY